MGRFDNLNNKNTYTMLKILFLGLVLVLHNTSGQYDDDYHSEEGLTIAGDFITRSEWENLKQELLDEVDVKIQDAMMDAGNENPDMDMDEYPEILGPAPPEYQVGG